MLLKVLLILDIVLLLALLVYLVARFSNKQKAQECCAKECCCEAVAVKPAVEEPKPAPVVAEEKELVITAVADDKDAVKTTPFCEKMLFLDRKTQEFYNALNNEFISYRKINDRVSSKGVSYRLGRELVAKITVRGKTMKLHLALPIDGFDQKIFFQKDLSDVKAYAEVPFTVKVKSDRGLKNAIKLISALAEAKAIEKKTRYNQVDSVEELKAIALKNR